MSSQVSSGERGMGGGGGVHHCVHPTPSYLHSYWHSVGWTHRALEAEGTSVGLFLKRSEQRPGPSLPGSRQCGSATPWWRERGPADSAWAPNSPFPPGKTGLSAFNRSLPSSGPQLGLRPKTQESDLA